MVVMVEEEHSEHIWSILKKFCRDLIGSWGSAFFKRTQDYVQSDGGRGGDRKTGTPVGMAPSKPR